MIKYKKGNIPTFNCKVINKVGEHTYRFSCNGKIYEENLEIAKGKDFNFGEEFQMTQFELEMCTVLNI